MEINYPIAGLILAVAIVFVLWLIRRNRKDEKKFEKDINESELKPEKHDENNEFI